MRNIYFPYTKRIRTECRQNYLWRSNSFNNFYAQYRPQLLKLLGFSEISYFETEPYARNIKSSIRLILWKLMKFDVNMIRFFGTAATEKILTKNFIGVA